jgi:superfamily II DNA or RNA helicase
MKVKTLRDIRQEEFADIFINTGCYGILNLCPRMGKIRTSINIIKKTNPRNILIAYPDNKIKDSWQADFEELEHDDGNVTYTTHLSLKKQVDQLYDLIIIDEIHLLSEAQIEIVKELIKNHDEQTDYIGAVLGLTGTLSKWTAKTLQKELSLCVIAEYPMATAIEEGVIVDYEIIVVKVPLDNVVKQSFKGKIRTEKKHYDSISWVIDKMEEEEKNTMFLRLARMRVIQNSLAKQACTKKIIDKFKEERILVFCGTTVIADSLGIPSYHSKNNEKEMFENFASGDGNHMAVVKIGNTGVTYKPLNKVIINYFDSNGENLAQKINRCMAMEYNNPEKKAIIYVVSSNEKEELKWLSRALEFFDKSKIKFVESL